MYSKIEHKNLYLPILIALFGMAVLFLATPHGAGLSPDSISYIRGSRSLLAHGSLGALSAHWPPAYPALLALFALPQGDPLLAARFICILAFGLNLFLFSVLLQKSGWSSLFAGLFAILLIFDPDFLNIHLMAWSEPMFLVFVMSGLLALSAFDASGSKKYLFAVGVAFGISALVRYAGLGFISGVALILLFQCVGRKSDDKFYKKLMPLLQFILIALLPISLWVLSKSLGAQRTEVRSMVFHSISPQKWHDALTTVAIWFGGVEAGFVVIGIVVLLLTLGNQHMSITSKRLLVFAGSLFAAYVLFILISLLYFDAYIPLDNRILSPAKLLVYLMIVVSMQAAIPKFRFLAIGVFSVFTIVLNYSDARGIMLHSSMHGVGFAQIEMKNQPILSFIRANHIEVDATNSPELTSLYLNQEVPMLPASYDPTTRLPVTDQASVLGKLAQPRNTVVIFNALLWRDYLPKPQQLMDAGFKNIIYQQPDGIILQHP